MDRDALLAAFDAQIRRGTGHAPGGVRVVSDADGWSGVTWSDLEGRDADAVIAAQITRFADQPGPWEWKHYSYDRPADLPQRLVAAGFTPEPAEAPAGRRDRRRRAATCPPAAGVELTAGRATRPESPRSSPCRRAGVRRATTPESAGRCWQRLA